MFVLSDVQLSISSMLLVQFTKCTKWKQEYYSSLSHICPHVTPAKWWKRGQAEQDDIVLFNVPLGKGVGRSVIRLLYSHKCYIVIPIRFYTRTIQQYKTNFVYKLEFKFLEWMMCACSDSLNCLKNWMPWYSRKLLKVWLNPIQTNRIKSSGMGDCNRHLFSSWLFRYLQLI